MKLLKNINNPADLKRLNLEELPALVAEIEAFVLQETQVKKGHIESSLTVNELSVALHYVLNTPNDALYWDVGHQAYVHKILTGRKGAFSSNRQKGGLSGFPNISESEYDLFTTGHSSTSISAITGMAIANRLSGMQNKHVVVIGDGALTAGLAFEALNFLGEHPEDILIVLNDNHSAIDANVGGLQKHGDYAAYFKSLGIDYLGKTDGHDVCGLVKKIGVALKADGPRVLHVMTKPYKIKSENLSALSGYTKSVINTLINLAKEDERIVAVTPAMLSGSGLNVFQEKFPKRCFDVGIAEQHAVTLSAGLARAGKIPVCHLYSTFSQRAYDQIVHDVALQNLPVIFLLDRAGLVGKDGATHHGVLDVAMLSVVPNMVVMAAGSTQEMSEMLRWAVTVNKPVAIRYPRSGGSIASKGKPKEIKLGQPEIVKNGSKKLAVVTFGFLLGEMEMALENCENPEEITLVNLRFAKPINNETIIYLASHQKIWVVEDSQARGGVGEYLAQQLFDFGYTGNYNHTALPDVFIEHGSIEELYAQYGLTSVAFSEKLKQLI